MSRYDLIVAGAGLSGLSFLWHLLEAGIGARRVLVLDRVSMSEEIVLGASGGMTTLIFHPRPTRLGASLR